MIRRLVVKTADSGEDVELYRDEGKTFNQPLGISLGTDFILNIAFFLVKLYSWKISEISLENSLMISLGEEDIEGMSNLYRYISTGDIQAARMFLQENNSRIIKIEFKTIDRERVSVYRIGIISQSTGDIKKHEKILNGVFSDVWRGGVLQ